MSKREDRNRMWMWWFVGILAALQFYFVRELVVAFALFTLVCAAIALVVAGAYAARWGWELALARVGRSSAPAVDLTEAVKAKVR